MPPSHRLAELLEASTIEQQRNRPRQDNGPKPAPVSNGLLRIEEFIGYIVYELYDQAGRLLYVGQTQDLADRLSMHRATAVFGRRIDHVRYQQVETFREMVDLEAKLIRELRPLHNVAGVSRHTPATLPPGTANMPRGTAKVPAKGLGILRPILAQSHQEGGESGLTDADRQLIHDARVSLGQIVARNAGIDHYVK